MTNPRILIFLLLLILLAACSGLASQPEIVVTFAPAPTAAPIQVENPEDLGRAIFEARCASCHGITGQGDGEVAIQAGVTVPDFTDATVAQSQTLEQWIYTINEGRIENLMPPWKNSLSAEEIQAVAEYTYTMWENAPVASETEPPQEEIGSIFGDVIFGTVGANADTSVSIGLHILDGSDDTVDFKLQVLEAGVSSYAFSDVPIRNDYAYLVSAIYQEMAFYSESIVGTPNSPDMNLPVHVYEVTNDDSVIEMDLLFLYMTQTDDRLMVQQFMSFTNTSDRLYQGTTQIDTVRYDSVRVTLPVGAEILNTEELGRRFMLSRGEERLTLVDTDPVQPDSQHLVEIVYSIPLPLNQGVMEISYPLHYELTNTPELLVQPDVFRVLGGGFTAMGAQSLDFGTFDSYLGQPIEQGESLEVRLNLTNGNRGLPQPSLPAIVAIAVGVIMAAVGAVMLFAFGDRLTEDDLVAALVALDNRYAAGDIAEAEYNQQRTKLKAKLAKIMK